MPSLPPLSGPEIIRALERLAFARVSQRGSHVKMRSGRLTVIVPLHREVKRRTLSSILRQAEVSANEFLKALSQ
jgi:predicted RNA binding protein YcfA (HicA-like mRNA interferase family)